MSRLQVPELFQMACRRFTPLEWENVAYYLVTIWPTKYRIEDSVLMEYYKEFYADAFSAANLEQVAKCLELILQAGTHVRQAAELAAEAFAAEIAGGTQ